MGPIPIVRRIDEDGIVVDGDKTMTKLAKPLHAPEMAVVVKMMADIVSIDGNDNETTAVE